MTRSMRPPPPTSKRPSKRPSKPPSTSKRPPHWPRARSSRPPTAIIMRTRRPLACCIIAIDAAKNAGVAVYVCGKLAAHSEIKTDKPLQRLDCLGKALALADECRVPTALVIETPSLARAAWKDKTYATAMSLKSSADKWADSWAQLGQPTRTVLRYTAGEWRTLLFGKASMPRELAQKFEQAYALQIILRDLRRAARAVDVELGTDEAAAICIGSTLTHSMAIRDALGCGVMP